MMFAILPGLVLLTVGTPLFALATAWVARQK